jgi:hypothetical protein
MGTDGKPKPVSPNVKTIGEVVIGTSAALLVAGIVILVAGPSTLLSTTSGQRIAKEPSVSLPGKLKLTASGIAF